MGIIFSSCYNHMSDAISTQENGPFTGRAHLSMLRALLFSPSFFYSHMLFLIKVLILPHSLTPPTPVIHFFFLLFTPVFSSLRHIPLTFIYTCTAPRCLFFDIFLFLLRVIIILIWLRFCYYFLVTILWVWNIY